ncbi:sugar ABC transporter permease [Vallitalea pronyensis]|uniref:Sugar ABC transporter permease n=1 Tax=Vallitalea pronyensis TaxID=1348613 RepID=A0A8J8SGN9_9FIRM|nr:sugar ABC transporter permease [Vallitalea pronyensis]QUI22960.1 sugar ABC transporter permease [Vallitalea pronyensis]
MKRRKELLAWIYLMPAILILAVFMFYPMIRSLSLSVSNFNFIGSPSFNGMENYQELIEDKNFLAALWNTARLSVVVIIANIILPILLAVLVNRQFKFINFFRASYYVPVITSMVVVGIIWQGLYAEYGIINYILLELGLIKESFNWLTNPNTALMAVGMVIIWRGLGYYMVIYLAGLQNIPESLYEAARIDGANRFKQFISVTVPMLMPSIVVVAVMTTINALKIFDEIYIMTQGGPIGSTETLVYFIYNQAFDKLNVGYASAAGVILFAISLLFSVMHIFLSRKSEEHIG